MTTREELKELQQLRRKVKRLEAFRSSAKSLLLASAEQSRVILETAPVSIIIFDHRENIFAWNARARQDFGRDFGETQGVFLGLILDQASQSNVRRIIQDVLEKGTSDMLETPIQATGLRKDMRSFPIEISIGHWNTPTNEVMFTLIVHNVEDHKG